MRCRKLPVRALKHADRDNGSMTVSKTWGDDVDHFASRVSQSARVQRPRRGENCTSVTPAPCRFTSNREGFSAVSVAVGPDGTRSAGKCCLERQARYLSQVEGDALPVDWYRRDDEGAVLLKTHQHGPLQLFSRQKS